MSKEKTLTAEEIKNKILKGISEVFRGKTIYMKDIEEDVEQYAQAKVLEALKNEFSELGLMAEFYYHDNGLEYYERAVKPKYKPKQR